MPRDTENDKFIGQRFGKNGQLEVTGWDGSRSDSYIKLYTVQCYVCKLDPELHGTATYKMPKGDIRAGTQPCGCSSIPKWTTNQYKVKVERLCVQKNLTLKGFSSDRIQSGTRISLKCNVCSYEWDTCDVSHFTGEGNGCPSCKKKAISAAQTKTDAEMISGFMASGAFSSDTRFWRSNKISPLGYKPYWNYECHVCSSDEYVTSGLCSGVFTSSSNHLRQGKQSCRCNGKFKWTKAQREYQINKKLERYPKHSFVGWVDEYVNNTSKVVINCLDHGNWSVSLSNFLGLEKRSCPDCAKGGYNRSIDGYVYVIKAESFYDSFTGYGITNDPSTRLSKHNYNVSVLGYSVVLSEVFRVTGRDAPVIEEEIKSTFPLYAQPIEGFKTEATHSYRYYDVVKFVKQRVALKD